VVASSTDDFQVTWKDPADAQKTWVFDPMHFPRPLVPMAADFLSRMYGAYMSADCRFVNGFAFNTPPMPRMPTREMMEKGVAEVWAKEFQPEIQAFCERIRAEDYDALNLAQMGDRILLIMEEGVKTFGYTMKVISGFMGPTFGLVEFLQKELGPEGPQMAAMMLQGYENGTAAAGTGLSDLAEEASKHPAVAEALRAGRYDSLESLEGGPAFLEKFNSYLDRFGWRVATWGEPEVPTWHEDPKTPLMLIGRYLQDPERSPAASIQRALEQRDAAVHEVEAKLPQDKLGEFRGALSASQTHVPMSENRALWQLITIGSLRVPFLALGKKLAAVGALDSADDVFYLETEEARDAARNPSAGVKETVSRRKADYERWRKLTPPPFIGSPPDFSKLPPEIVPMALLFAGIGMPEMEGKEIKGQAASRGVVTGRARIIHDLREADRLQTGEVLVCTTTAPPWTPLFAIAGAVVTDSGGVLSHSAICAREYAIPCVVATHIATRVIPDGATVRVDGTKGTVTIEG
jgi:phosphohistidine swiveling domain-containing protein